MGRHAGVSRVERQRPPDVLIAAVVLRPLREAIITHLDSRRVARVLYGAIIGLALVLALEAHPPAAGEVAGTLVATGIAVALAEAFSEIIGAETRSRARIERQQMRSIASDAGAVAVGIGFPALFFVLAAIGAMQRDTAFDLARWSGLGLIAAYGFAAARLTGETAWRSLWRAALAALIGGFLIVIKALLH